MKRFLLALLIACTPLSAYATSKVRVEFVKTTLPDDTRGNTINAPAAAFSAINLTVASSGVQTATAPSFGRGGGYASLTGLVGAVVCTWDGSTPADTLGVRVEAGKTVYVPVNAAAVVKCVESLDQPISGTTIGAASTPGNGTIAVIDTPQALFSGVIPANGFKVGIPADIGFTCWVSDSVTNPGASVAGSWPVNSGRRYSTEPGEKPVGPVYISCPAITTFSAKRW